MTKVIFRDDVTVELRDYMGSEDAIVETARVSTEGANSRGSAANRGLIKYLYREGHSLPFQCVEFRFYFEVPIFVSRQIVKHRISEINEESGRYKKLRPMFYVPNEERKLVQVGKTGDYNFEPGRPDQYQGLKFVLESSAQSAWDNYEALLDAGISKEVARMHLPVNTYTSMYFKANLGSVLNFLSKRKEWENAETVSHAQHEIAMVSDKMSEIVKEKLPTVWECFVESGYRAI